MNGILLRAKKKTLRNLFLFRYSLKVSYKKQSSKNKVFRWTTVCIYVMWFSMKCKIRLFLNGTILYRCDTFPFEKRLRFLQSKAINPNVATHSKRDAMRNKSLENSSRSW